MDEANPPFPAPRWWFGLAAALLLGLGGVLVFSIRENGRRGELETISEPSAVGDTRFFVPPAALDKVSTLARWKGRALLAEEIEPVEIRDSRMKKLGDDETGGFSIYEARDPDEKGFLFFKLERDRYLKVR